MCDGANVKNLEEPSAQTCPLQAPGAQGLVPARVDCCCQVALCCSRGDPRTNWRGASSRASHGVYPLQLAVEPPEEDHIQP